MDLVYLALRTVLGLVFLSSGISKFSNMTQHIGTVKKYKILPPKLARPFSILETTFETIVSILLILGMFIKVSSLLLFSLLFVYTIGIIVNLIRGNTDLSCGCGGVVRDHDLSWKQPLRNLVLGSLLLALYFKAHSLTSIVNVGSITLPEVSTFIFSILMILLYVISSYYKEVSTIFLHIQNFKKESV